MMIMSQKTMNTMAHENQGTSIPGARKWRRCLVRQCPFHGKDRQTLLLLLPGFTQPEHFPTILLIKISSESSKDHLRNGPMITMAGRKKTLGSNVSLFKNNNRRIISNWRMNQRMKGAKKTGHGENDHHQTRKSRRFSRGEPEEKITPWTFPFDFGFFSSISFPFFIIQFSSSTSLLSFLSSLSLSLFFFPVSIK